MLRAVAHLAAWLPFVLGPAGLIRGGWRPVGDEAAIALRSWNLLTAQGPMVGQATRLAHGVFDPGPLEYWLLAIPVHLDTTHGVLWGAALFCLVACSLAVEAAWSVLGAAGGLCASGLIVGLMLWIPGIAVTPSWNPWFGMVFFIAALAAAWAVMSGHRGWWPALVITASIAAQAHLMFTVPSGVLAILALIVGLADSIRGRLGYWWALAGLLAGAACWSAPLIQQFTSPDGNLGLLLTQQRRHDRAADRRGIQPQGPVRRGAAGADLVEVVNAAHDDLRADQSPVGRVRSGGAGPAGRGRDHGGAPAPVPAASGPGRRDPGDQPRVAGDVFRDPAATRQRGPR